jgi:hypothetical protein
VCRFEVTGVSSVEPAPVLWHTAEEVVTDAPTVFVPTARARNSRAVDGCLAPASK